MRARYDLNGSWEFEPLAWIMLQSDGSEKEVDKPLPARGTMQIPANWHYSGLPDFFGRVRFTRQFNTVLDTQKSAYLCFTGVDYACEIRLDGHYVGRHEGCFQAFEFEITPYLRDSSSHVLEVIVESPNEEPISVWPHKKRLIKGILSHWDAKQGSWDNDTGQDGNTGGIWGDVYLEYRNPVHIDSVSLHTQLLPKTSKDNVGLSSWESREDLDDSLKAYIWINVKINGQLPVGKKAEIKITLTDEEGQVFEKKVPVHSLENDILFVLPDPKLWWTWDLGEQHMYLVATELLLEDETKDRHQYYTGLREIEVDPSTGTWKVNGKRLFIRGTNVIPSLWLAHYTNDTLEKDINLLKGAYINAVRVCVHVTKPEFYVACDKAGILIWQDFLLQWGYANENSIVESACRQIKDMVRQLKQYTSISVWCCQNESLFFNNEVVGPQLVRAVKEEDNSRYVHPVSHFNEHPYPGWYGDHMEAFKSFQGSKMVTEFGAQALPSVGETIEMNGSSDWPPNWDELGYHDFQYDQTFYSAKIDAGDNWDTFVKNSQHYQSKLLKLAIEFFRHARFEKLGAYFQFMFMDCWPAITWSVVSYKRIPKKGYQTLQQVNQPVLVGTNLGRDCWFHKLQKGGGDPEITIFPWVINDFHKDLNDCEFAAFLETEDGRTKNLLNKQHFNIGPDTLYNLPSFNFKHVNAYNPGAYRLVFQVTQKDQVISTNTYDITIGV